MLPPLTPPITPSYTCPLLLTPFYPVSSQYNPSKTPLTWLTLLPSLTPLYHPQSWLIPSVLPHTPSHPSPLAPPPSTDSGCCHRAHLPLFPVPCAGCVFYANQHRVWVHWHGWGSRVWCHTYFTLQLLRVNMTEWVPFAGTLVYLYIETQVTNVMTVLVALDRKILFDVNTKVTFTHKVSYYTGWVS